MALNSSFYLCLPIAGITDLYHHTWGGGTISLCKSLTQQSLRINYTLLPLKSILRTRHYLSVLQILVHLILTTRNTEARTMRLREVICSKSKYSVLAELRPEPRQLLLLTITLPASPKNNLRVSVLMLLFR
jgi:hypothetical protein